MPVGSVYTLSEGQTDRHGYDETCVCVRERERAGVDVHSRLPLLSKDSGTQCETERGAAPWDKYRLDIARGS